MANPQPPGVSGGSVRGAVESTAGAGRFGEWYAVCLLSIATFLSYLDRGAIAVLVTGIKQEMGLTDVQIGLLQGISFSAFFALAGVPLGLMADRLNRRNLIAAGISLWSAATFLCGYAETFLQLLLARMAVGVGEAALIPAAGSLIASLFQPEKRGKPMSAIVAAQSFGAAGASLLGGMLLLLLSGRGPIDLPFFPDAAHWRVVLVLFGIPGPLVAMLMLMMREPPRPPVSARECGILEFVSRRPLLFVGLYLSFAMNFIIAYSQALWSPTVLSRSYGFSPGNAGVVFGSVMIFASVSGSTLGGILGDALAKRNVAMARHGISLATTPLAMVGGVLMICATNATMYLSGFACGAFAAGVLIGASYPILYEIVPPSLRGRAAAIYMIVGNVIGLGGGPLAVGLLMNSVYQDTGHAGTAVGAVVLSAALTGCALLVATRNAYRRAIDAVAPAV